MPAGRRRHPPRLAEWVLQRVVPPGIAGQSIVGDAREEYVEHLESGSLIPARGWYWVHVIRMAMHFAIKPSANRSGPQRSRAWLTLVGSVAQDVRLATRSFLRSPGFAGVAVVTLAVGIGGTSSMFSVVNGVVLRSLPFPDANRLVRVFTTQPGNDRDNVSGADFIDWKAQTESFTGMAGYDGISFNFVRDDTPQRLRGATVTANFFDVLGVSAMHGRVFSEGEQISIDNRTVVLSHALWQTVFAGDQSVLGRTIVLNDEQYVVLGIMPPTFDFPGRAQLWAASRFRVPDPPMDLGPDPAENRDAEYFDVIARLEQGIGLAQAQAELDIVAAHLADEYQAVHVGEGVAAVPLLESLVGSVRTILFVLLGAVGFVLLIACVNVANLLLVRATTREKEMAIRTALGAERRRLIRQLLIESLVLSFLAATLGVVLAAWGTSGLLALLPADLPRLSEVGVDLRVLAFAATVAMVTGVLFGLAPAFKLGGQSSTAGALVSGGRHSSHQRGVRLRHGLIVVEVAVSLMLLVGAGLAIRTFHGLSKVDPGFRSDDLVTATLSLPSPKYSDDAQVIGFYRDLLERARSVPGVETAGVILSPPVAVGITGELIFTIEGRETASSEDARAGYQLASPDYFAAMGIPLLTGRVFTDADREDAPAVVVVSDALADLYWPNEDPIGQRVTWGDPSADDAEWVTIVGVVGNTRHFGLDEAVRPETYRPYPQSPLGYMTVVLRSAGAPTDVASAVRQVVADVDPALPVARIATMKELLNQSLGWRRFNMVLLGLFAVASVVMAAVGLFGVLSFTVAQRAREIGIRMALGADGGRVVGQVVGQAVKLAGIGLVIGSAGALLTTRLMGSMVHGISSTDPMTFMAGAVTILVVTIAATLVPAFRAAGVDPMRALRAE